MKRFEVGRTYSTRSICDYDCIFRFEVVGRTDKTVLIKYHGKVTRRKIRAIPNHSLAGILVETIDPLGVYSMSPVLDATDD